MEKKINRDYVNTPRKEDVAYETASSVTSMVPGCGGIFKFIFENPAMKRRDDWIESLEKRIKDLEEKHSLNIEDLQTNEQFISAVFYASSTAIKTHSKSKCTALLNAITNIAIGIDLDKNKQDIFLNLIDEFTELHISVLNFFYNPEDILKELETRNNTSIGNSSFASVFKNYYNIADEDESLINIIVNSLYSYGLINLSSEQLTTTMSRSGLTSPRVTELGKEFIEFIEFIKYDR